MAKNTLKVNAELTTQKVTIKKVNVPNAIARREAFLNMALENIDACEVHISNGNSKMGVIPSFSVLPIITCKNCKDCSGYCYAAKNAFNFNNNIMNLSDNTALVMRNPERVKDAINAHLNNNTTIYRYFRYNVAGDVFNIDYLNIIIEVAKNNPFTTFLVFTKNYDLFKGNADRIPENVSVVFSQWDNDKTQKKYNSANFPVAIVKVNENTAIPENAFHCAGDCANCLDCWKAEKGSVRYFDLH